MPQFPHILVGVRTLNLQDSGVPSRWLQLEPGRCLGAPWSGPVAGGMGSVGMWYPRWLCLLPEVVTDRERQASPKVLW